MLLAVRLQVGGVAEGSVVDFELWNALGAALARAVVGAEALLGVVQVEAGKAGTICDEPFGVVTVDLVLVGAVEVELPEVIELQRANVTDELGRWWRWKWNGGGVDLRNSDKIKRGMQWPKEGVGAGGISDLASNNTAKQANC